MLPPHLDRAARNARAHALHGRALGVDVEAQRRIERGWPNLRVLEPEAAPRAALKAARQIFESIDPCMPPVWPREVAVRWVNAFLRGTPPFAAKGAKLEAALGNTEPPDAALLRKHFERSLASLDGYPYQHADAIWIAEALLGSDAVVETYAAAIAAAPRGVWSWPSAKAPNPHHNAIKDLTAVGWVFLRATPGVAEAALASIRAARSAHPGAAGFARAVDFLLGEAVPDVAKENERRLRVIHLSEDLAKARALHSWCLWICDPQDSWITGVTPPLEALAKLSREPRYLVEQLVATWGAFDHPFAAALRSGFVEPPKLLTKKQLTTKVRALFERLVHDVRQVRGAPAEEARLFRQAALDLTALRARAGDPTPDVHVGHILGVDGWDAKTEAPVQTLDATPDELERWLEAVRTGLR